ncbi:glycosyltransferase family 4 protein [Paenibacillus allorhizosphaerae]|uniref:Spore protein YkvP/CgeB glycosyl transferase-like domain-containing protein n=1 Tax=Paenibacillus allorhizosphaerae TaxID=2849866 RepID=A0ABN7TS03_9BACL|nr:glycosyltransferase [Paenibacillus allorhizosphaerae]CAG7649079.1 hypothetical protein PAECIP111802_04398 [Paenibacillus allorhizosphaerae]
MNVLHLPYGIGISTMARALRAQGVSASSASFKSTNVYNYLAHIRLNLDQYPASKRNEIRKKFLEEAIQKYDLFHFHFGETFFPDKSDVKILAAMGKKMIVEHRGSEVRMLSIARNFNNPFVRVKRSFPEQTIRYNLKLLSSYIDYAVVPDHELLPYIEPYYKKTYVVPRAIDASGFTPQYPSPDPNPLIVHAPSRRELKGTEYVLSAIERLQKDGFQFQFKLIENLPHEEALQLYQNSAIVIDQLLIGAYANLSMEAMAMGKPVLCYIRDDLFGKYPPGLPIVSANPDTIYDALKNLLSRPDTWQKLGMEGRRYVEQHHSMDKAASALLNVYNEIVGKKV